MFDAYIPYHLYRILMIPIFLSSSEIPAIEFTVLLEIRKASGLNKYFKTFLLSQFSRDYNNLSPRQSFPSLHFPHPPTYFSSIFPATPRPAHHHKGFEPAHRHLGRVNNPLAEDSTNTAVGGTAGSSTFTDKQITTRRA